MASTKPTKTPARLGRDARDGTRGLLDALARTAMSQLAGGPKRGPVVDHDAAAAYVTRAVLDMGGYDQRAVLAGLATRGIDPVAILDVCVPKSAEALGEAWVEDEISFTQVSAAASRLYGLCKAVGQEWDNHEDLDDALLVLLVSFRREDHMLGPGILAQQLRRRGHSVRIMSNTDAGAVAERLRAGRFDCVMVSAASLVAFETAIEELTALKRQNDRGIPVVLGGKALDYGATTETGDCVDIVTSDLDMAFDELDRWHSGRAAP